MEVPVNPGEEPRAQGNQRPIQDIAGPLRNSISNRMIESSGRPQRPESRPPSLRNLIKKAVTIIIFLIALYYGLKILLLLIIAMENSR